MMTKKIIIGALVLTTIGGAVWWGMKEKRENGAAPVEEKTSQEKSVATKKSAQLEALPNTTELTAPIDRADERVTKKPFGLLIDPKTSPVQPERFRGYHTGTDFETFDDEKNVSVSVKAICTGVIEMKRRAAGYGGLVVGRCMLNNEPIAVLYGHLALGSVQAGVGDTVEAGSVIGNLGEAGSSDTDRERKHLHLGIHKGSGPVNIRGYVSSQKELDRFIDSCQYVCGSK